YVALAAAGSGGHVSFGSPNSETGMTITGQYSRADIRFDDQYLQLLAGPVGGPPSSTNGIEITRRARCTSVRSPRTASWRWRAIPARRRSSRGRREAATRANSSGP